MAGGNESTAGPPFTDDPMPSDTPDSRDGKIRAASSEAMDSSTPEPGSVGLRERQGKRQGKPGKQPSLPEVQEDIVPSDLSFQQARTALDLLIAELQSNDLQVEEMLNLYRRAEAYADHCEAVLQKVDQDVIEWDVLQEAREISS